MIGRITAGIASGSPPPNLPSRRQVRLVGDRPERSLAGWPGQQIAVLRRASLSVMLPRHSGLQSTPTVEALEVPCHLFRREALVAG